MFRFGPRSLHFKPAGIGGAAPVQQGAPGSQTAHGTIVPFIVGSNLYREPPFDTNTLALDANSHDRIVNITPGGFLRGVVLQITSTGGVIGTGVLATDGPYSIFNSIAIEDIGGGSVLYPMNGFAHAMRQKWLQPWEGDPSKRPGFSNTINPAFTLRLSVEVRDTLAVLANTDARAQYRLRYTVAPLNPGLLSTTGTATAPTVTIASYISTWAQPDAQDLLGSEIQELPDGLAASRFVMHELPVFNAGNNTLRHTLMGNEIRGILWIVRNSLGARVDLTDTNTGAIDFRLDNRREWKMRPSQIVEEMSWFYEQIQNGTWTRETGVYAIPRFRDPGRLLGEHWLQTVEQTLLQAELAGGDLGGNAPGTIEIIYDELAIATGPEGLGDLEGI